MHLYVKLLGLESLKYQSTYFLSQQSEMLVGLQNYGSISAPKFK
uniref:Uncharacterized protein n=1 Tax=Anguilla anguilla TaxID=7936 RepID=A0A0E9QIN0_ANGAN